jgi:hypothetical protein
MKKGQSQIISALSIVIVSLVIVGTVFSWAVNVIQKKKDSKSLDDVYQFFQEFEATITNIARTGGEESIKLDVPGIITVYPENYPDSTLNNSVVFEFRSKVSNVAAIDGWIPLNTPNTNTTATLGLDKPSVIFGKAKQEQDMVTIWYRLWFRELEDKSLNKKYKIAINTSDNQLKTTNKGFLRVQRLESITGEGGNLIITQINIIV